MSLCYNCISDLTRVVSIFVRLIRSVAGSFCPSHVFYFVLTEFHVLAVLALCHFLSYLFLTGFQMHFKSYMK